MSPFSKSKFKINIEIKHPHNSINTYLGGFLILFVEKLQTANFYFFARSNI